VRTWAFIIFVSLFLLEGAQADAPASTQPSDEQTAFATRLEHAMNAGDEIEAESMFDYDAFFRRTTAGMTLTTKQATDYRQSHRPVFAFVPNVHKQGTTFHLLRIRYVNNDWRALYRTITPDGGFNYDEYVMVLNGQHQWRFADLYTIGLGELQSNIDRRLVNISMAAENHNFAQLSQYERDCLNNSDAFGKMAAEQQARDYEKELATYYSLPLSMRHSHLPMYMRLVASAQLLANKPEEFNAAAAEFQKLFPGGPCQDLIRYHMCIASKDYDHLYELLDRLQKYTGGDPYLLWIKGHYKILEGGDQNVAEARQLFRQAIQDEPTLSNPYFGLVDLALHDKDYKQTVSLLDTIQTNLGIRFRKLEQVSAYADFVKSDAYRKWHEHNP
jgi:hypothetical protein